MELATTCRKKIGAKARLALTNETYQHDTHTSCIRQKIPPLQPRLRSATSCMTSSIEKVILRIVVFALLFVHCRLAIVTPTVVNDLWPRWALDLLQQADEFRFGQLSRYLARSGHSYQKLFDSSGSILSHYSDSAQSLSSLVGKKLCELTC